MDMNELLTEADIENILNTEYGGISAPDFDEDDQFYDLDSTIDEKAKLNYETVNQQYLGKELLNIIGYDIKLSDLFTVKPKK